MSTAIAAEKCRHCGGSGYEPPTEADRAQLLADLREAGSRRAEHSSSRTLAGRQALNQAFEDIRVLAAEAERLRVTKLEVAEAVGLKRAALYNILSGKAGG